MNLTEYVEDVIKSLYEDHDSWRCSTFIDSLLEHRHSDTTIVKISALHSGSRGPYWYLSHGVHEMPDDLQSRLNDACDFRQRWYMDWERSLRFTKAVNSWVDYKSNKAPKPSLIGRIFKGVKK